MRPEPDEVSEAIFIEAASEAQALDWGREISEAFVAQLFTGQNVSWRAMNFAHWIERDPHLEYPADVLAILPVVDYGNYPDFARFKRSGRADA